MTAKVSARVQVVPKEVGAYLSPSKRKKPLQTYQIIHSTALDDPQSSVFSIILEDKCDGLKDDYEDILKELFVQCN